MIHAKSFDLVGLTYLNQSMQPKKVPVARSMKFQKFLPHCDQISGHKVDSYERSCENMFWSVITWLNKLHVQDVL